VTNSNGDAGSGGPGAGTCADCGAALEVSQRYCLQCGARRGPLPAVVADRVGALKERGRREGARANGKPLAPADASAEAKRDDSEKVGPWSFMPSPQVAAIAVMALLAAGVVLGSVINPLARGAGAASLILEEMGGSESAEGEPEEPPAAASNATAETPTFAAPPEVPLAVPLESPTEPEAPPPPAQLPPELPEEEVLPEIKHVFLIVLDSHGYEEAFGRESPAPYLAKTLAGEGKLLSNYYAVTQGGLANEIALLSGQGPTPQTALNCPEYTAIAPGTASVDGQVEGEGCVYPTKTETLPKQLSEAQLTWKAYVEDIANAEESEQAASCYLTLRNPVAYFAELTESSECSESDVGLDQLAPDLKKAEDTPSFSYIVPNACHDGSEMPCAPEQLAGLPAAEGFLETVVPEIAASPAYEEEGGLIAITFDQAPQDGSEPDTSSCCATPEYPNLPPPPAPASAEPPTTGPIKPTGGGGRVGMLLISPYLASGTVEEDAYYNHFSFLRSVEELFGLEPLGYAAEPALSGFEPSLFDASPEESTAKLPEKQVSSTPAQRTRSGMKR
jgi:phosphatidylinositol-3-phosphatase